MLRKQTRKRWISRQQRQTVGRWENSYLCRFGTGVQRDEEDLHDALLADREWNAQVAEGVKGHRDFAALWTDECGLEEAVKRVDNHRVIPSPMVSPCLLSHFLRVRKERRRQFW